MAFTTTTAFRRRKPHGAKLKPKGRLFVMLNWPSRRSETMKVSCVVFSAKAPKVTHSILLIFPLQLS